MKMNRKMWLGSLLTVVVAGIAFADDKQAPAGQPPKPAPSQPPPKTEKVSTELPVIGHLESADRRITIKAGPNGPIYSVKTAEGRTLFENLSAEQLRAKAPELHQIIKTGVAGKAGDARVRVKADASLRDPGRR